MAQLVGLLTSDIDCCRAERQRFEPRPLPDIFDNTACLVLYQFPLLVSLSVSPPDKPLAFGNGRIEEKILVTFLKKRTGVKQGEQYLNNTTFI